MESIQLAEQEPPSPARGVEASFPARAFGYGTSRYWSFIQALVDGLRAYDALQSLRGDRADVEYVRILHLAASTMESTVEVALALLLDQERAFDYATVRDLAGPERPSVPRVHIAAPDLRVYDALLAGGAP